MLRGSLRRFIEKEKEKRKQEKEIYDTAFKETYDVERKKHLEKKAKEEAMLRAKGKGGFFKKIGEAGKELGAKPRKISKPSRETIRTHFDISPFYLKQPSMPPPTMHPNINPTITRRKKPANLLEEMGL